MGRCCTGGSGGAGGAGAGGVEELPAASPVTCQLLPLRWAESKKAVGKAAGKAHWPADQCYTSGGALFTSDTRRLIESGGLRRR